MTGYERYTKLVKGQRVDILPRLPILMQFAAKYIGSNYGAFASDYRVLVEANHCCALHFGIDQLSAISDPYRETHGFGADIVFVRDGVPKCPHPPLEQNKNFSSLLPPNPLKSERMLDRVNAMRAYKQDYDSQYSIMGWIEGPAAEAATLRGTSNFLIDLLDDEFYACELMDKCVEVAIKFGLAQIKAGADTIGIGDAIASQVSPTIYERLIQPREKKMIKSLNKAGAITRLHICGDITHLLPGIADLGVDIVDVDHMVKMSTVRKIVGDKVVITGNIDPVEGVLFGRPEKIREYILKTYQEVGNPYMVNAGCEIPAGTPPENLLALCAPIEFVP